MPNIVEFAESTLGEDLSSLLNFLDYRSVEDFLLHFDKIYSCNVKNHQVKT